METFKYLSIINARKLLKLKTGGYKTEKCTSTSSRTGQVFVYTKSTLLQQDGDNKLFIDSTL